MYYAGKMITVVFSGFCICFTKDLQSVFLFLNDVTRGLKDHLLAKIYYLRTRFLRNDIQNAEFYPCTLSFRRNPDVLK
jgi:hypothetical protein